MMPLSRPLCCLVLVVLSTGCAVRLSGLGDPDPGDGPRLDTGAAPELDSGSIEPDAMGDVGDDPDAVPIPDTYEPDVADTTPATETEDHDTGDVPGVVRCGPAADLCDNRSGSVCCALADGRRCVHPGDPVPDGVCPQPALCDDGSDCRRPGFGVMIHCCQRPTTGAAECRSACQSGETEAL